MVVIKLLKLHVNLRIELKYGTTGNIISVRKIINPMVTSDILCDISRLKSLFSVGPLVFGNNVSTN